jgi:hypothetical protein
MAAQVGLSADYAATTKMWSKMVHPTAQSILWIEIEDQTQANRDLILLDGCKHLNEMVADMVTFVAVLVEP